MNEPALGAREMWPSVAIVVPVKNNRLGVVRCIESIRAARYPGPHTITVVDNGSTDGSGEAAAALGASVVSVPTGGVSIARNTGARATTGEILAFIDADQRIREDWIERGVATVLAHPLSVVGSSPFPPEQPTWVQAVYDGLRSRSVGVGMADWLGAGGLLLHRSTFEQAGGFDTTLETCEDVDLCRRVRDAGGEILNDSDLHIIHDGDPKTLSALFRGELWRGKDNLRVTLKRRPTLRELPSVLLPVLSLAGFAAVAVGLLTFKQGGRSWLTAGALALALTTLFRVAVIGWRLHLRGGLDVWAVLPVAFTYETARALALVSRTSHQARRR